MERGLVWPTLRAQRGRQLGRRHKAPERKLLCVIVTLSFAKASRQAVVSEVRPVQVAECHGPPVRKRSGQLGRDSQYETGCKGCSMPQLTSLRLIMYITYVAQRNFKYEPGFHSPGG